MASFLLQGEKLEDGRIYVTSESLPGFRLVVHPGQNIETEIDSALRVFYPFHRAAEARAEAQKITPHVARRNSTGREFSFYAEFAVA